MVNKKFWLGILAMVLVFGMTVVGCDDGSTDDDDYEYKPSFFGIVYIDNVAFGEYSRITWDNTPVVGETLTARFEGSGTVGTATWEWIRGASTVINGATSNSYTVSTADVGQTLKARVSYSGNQGNRESSSTNSVVGIPSTVNVSISIEAIVDATWMASSDRNVFSVNVYLTLSDGVWKFGNDGVDYSMVRSWVTMSGTPNVNNLGIGGNGQWNFGPYTGDRRKLRLNYYTTYPKSTGNISISGLTATLDTTKLIQMKDYTNVTGSVNSGSPSTASSSTWVPGNG
jgi:hypothetical protein